MSSIAGPIVGVVTINATGDGTGTAGAYYYASPLTVTNTGAVWAPPDSGDAISTSLAGASLNNYGQVSGANNVIQGNGYAGVSFAAHGTVTNSGGTITGGSGAAGDYNGNGGGAGGAGIAFSANGTVDNSGSVSGGSGGRGGYVYAYNNYNGGSGGTGGAGIVFSGAAGTVDNTGTIVGGAGGAGEANSNLGGDGGAGILLTAGGTVYNNGGTITGGAGGAQADVQYSGAGGPGIMLVTGGTVDNTGVINGGSDAGSGITGADGGTIENFGSIVGGTGVSGDGGTGGVGISLVDGSISNSGSIIGGVGGQGQGAYYAYGTGNVGGVGGVGVAMSGGYLYNQNTIRGGVGGIGGTGQNGGAGGTGGVGVSLAGGGTINNGGFIVGGFGGLGQNGVYNGVYGDSGENGNGGIGLSLSDGGTVINTGAIYGGYDAGVAIIATDGGTIINSGTINGNYAAGIGISGAGGVTVQNSGSIVGGDARMGSDVAGGSGISLVGGRVSNTGTITAGAAGAADSDVTGVTGATGVALSGGGYLSNQNTIIGGAGGAGGIGKYNGGMGGTGGVGVSLAGGGTIDNTGTILGGSGGSGGYATGKYPPGGGPATPGTPGSPGSVGTGIVLSDGGTVIDSGRVDGATAIVFGGDGANRLVLDPGYSLSGAVIGSTTTGATNTLELASLTPGDSGMVAQPLQSEFQNFGTIAVDSGANWALTGTNSSIANSGTLEVKSGATLTGGVSFGGASGDIKIDGAQSPGIVLPGFTIANMIAGDQIDLAGVAYNATNSANYAGGTLAVTENGHTYDLKLSSVPSGYYFHLMSDGASGTDITENQTACYCRGTLILTSTGEVPVEDLVIGDLVVTLSGEARPIKWIGRRGYTGRFLSGNRDVLPIRIKPGALADGVPTRDLFVSPEHALYLDEALVPARLLANGVSIVQVEDVESVEYFHIELATHEVIFAEGAAAESFVDDDSRMMFHNAAEYFRLYPGRARAPALYCAPRLEDSFALEALRRRLAGRARRLDAEGIAVPSRVCGHLKLVQRDWIEGWAFDPAAPESPLTIIVLDNGAPIARLVADRYREDLAKAGIGDGRHSFRCAIPGGLEPNLRHRLELCLEAGGAPLVGATIVLQPLAA